MSIRHLVDLDIDWFVDDLEKFLKDWDESEHPRDEHGQFANAGGGDDEGSSIGGVWTPDNSPNYFGPSTMAETKIKDEIARNEKLQEDINETSIMAGNTPGTTQGTLDRLERKHVALEAINYVLKNDLKAHHNPSIADKSSFRYEIDANGHVVAAIHYSTDGKVAEIKWVGSTRPGAGAFLMQQAIDHAKAAGVEVVKLTAKWGSEAYHDQFGFMESGDRNPLTDSVPMELWLVDPLAAAPSEPKLPLEGGSDDRPILDALKAADIDVHRDAKEIVEQHWSEVGVTPAQFRQSITNGRDAYIRIESYPDDGEASFTATADFVDGSKNQFTFNFTTNEAHYDYVRMKKTGGGEGSKLIKNAIDLFQTAGMDSVSLLANIDVGSYAWAKYGFTPNYWPGLQQDLQYRLDRNLGISDDAKEQLATLLKSDDPRIVWAVSDAPGGRQLMMNMSWDGTLDFNDDKAMRRFDAYIAKKAGK